MGDDLHCLLTRDPSGRPGVYGALRMPRRGRRGWYPYHPNSSDLQRSRQVSSTKSALGIMRRLETHYQEGDIEFTIERGKLWMLRVRVGKRTPRLLSVMLLS